MERQCNAWSSRRYGNTSACAQNAKAHRNRRKRISQTSAPIPTYNKTFLPAFLSDCGHSGHQLSKAHSWGPSAASRSHPASNESGERHRGGAAVLPLLPLDDHRDHCQVSKHQELLALCALQGDLGSCSPADSDDRTVAPMIEQATGVETARWRIVRELEELIAALDRRVPQVHRVGELAIARAAAALRGAALKRIEELESDATPDARPVQTAETASS
jgi:hypothetical protein